MAYGNTSVSSLLNQARAALKKQQGLEEEVAAYEYDLSPKDQAAYDKYSSFLDSRIKQVQSSDPSKALSLQRKITGAQRTFTSSELTRESIGIAEGTGSKPAKLNKMIALYRKALENGDENLAQRIQLQADNLQVQIQNEAMAGAGRGGGGSDDTDKATKKGINAQLSKIETAKKDFKNDLSSGKISSSEYIGKVAQLYDAQNKVLQSTYQVDGDGNIVQNQHSGLSYDSVKEFYDKHNSLQGDPRFQQIMGTNPNVPFDLRMAQIGNAFKAKVDPLSGEVNLEPNNIVGLRRMTEFGSTLAAPTTEDNVNSKQYSEGFKKLGLSGGDRGSTTKTYTDINGNKKEASFYLDNPDNPSYAYTQDENGVRYALDKDGKAVMLGDSASADKQISALKARLENPNISPQEREAIMNDIQNVNTDMLPSDLVPGIQNKSQDQIDAQNNIFGIEDTGKGLRKIGKEFSNDAGFVLDKARKGLAIDKIRGLATGLGIAGAFTGPAGQLGGFGAIGAIGDLTKKLTGMKQQADAKAAADAAARAAEFQRNQEAIAASRANQAAYEAQTKAQNRQQVNIPYNVTAQGKQEAKTIGTPSFNTTYLGAYGDLLNKYKR